MSAPREKRIQIRHTPEEDAALAEMASDLGLTKHAIAAISLSLGLRALRQAYDNATVSATVQVFNSIERIGIDPKDLTPEQWEQIRALLDRGASSPEPE